MLFLLYAVPFGLEKFKVGPNANQTCWTYIRLIFDQAFNMNSDIFEIRYLRVLKMKFNILFLFLLFLLKDVYVMEYGTYCCSVIT